MKKLLFFLILPLFFVACSSHNSQVVVLTPTVVKEKEVRIVKNYEEAKTQKIDRFGVDAKDETSIGGNYDKKNSYATQNIKSSVINDKFKQDENKTIEQNLDTTKKDTTKQNIIAFNGTLNVHENVHEDKNDSSCKVYFDFDSYKIKQDMKSCIALQADKLQKNNSIILLQGNCDEFGTQAYNYNLGLKRAISVKNELIKRGLHEERIKIASLGKDNPICKENTDDCRIKNRRVEFISQ